MCYAGATGHGMMCKNKKLGSRNLALGSTKWYAGANFLRKMCMNKIKMNWEL